MHSNAGFAVPTEIKASSIPHAGLGRFNMEQVKSGCVVRADPLVSTQYFISNGGVSADRTVAVEILSKEDIDALVEHFVASKTTPTEKIRTMLSWFIAGVAAERTDRGRPLVYLLAHSFHTNHGDVGCVNMETTVENGILYHKAVRDIARNSELLLDYTKMDIGKFAKTWCVENDCSDVEAMAHVEDFGTKSVSQV